MVGRGDFTLPGLGEAYILRLGIFVFWVVIFFSNYLVTVGVGSSSKPRKFDLKIYRKRSSFSGRFEIFSSVSLSLPGDLPTVLMVISLSSSRYM